MRIEADVIRTILGVALIGAILAAVMWMPGPFRRGTLNRRIVQAQHRIADGEQAAARLGPLRATVKGMESQYQRDARHVPVQPELADLMRQLHTTLYDRGVEDLRSEHHDEFIGAQYNIVPVEFGFRGGFVDAFVFLEQAETMRRMLRVDYLHVGGEPGIEPDQLDVTVKLSSFYAPVELMKAPTGTDGGDSRP